MVQSTILRIILFVLIKLLAVRFPSNQQCGPPIRTQKRWER
uniref:Uncharacterized protein n=1 Tax=Anguilla anguilla TaxID=7936 RepID=A0A0E9V7J8_ANGAN